LNSEKDFNLIYWMCWWFAFNSCYGRRNVDYTEEDKRWNERLIERRGFITHPSLILSPSPYSWGSCQGMYDLIGDNIDPKLDLRIAKKDDIISLIWGEFIEITVCRDEEEFSEILKSI
jgi:hypothetical protein